MPTQQKAQYATPVVVALELRIEGVISSSGDPQFYNNPFSGGEIIL